MRSFICGCLVAFLVVGLAPYAADASITGLYFPGQLNLGSDNSAEFLIDVNRPALAPPSQLDIGDIVITAFNIQSVEDLTGPGGTEYLASYGIEATGLSAIEVTNKIPLGGGNFQMSWGPLTPAGLFALNATPNLGNIQAEVATWAPGTMIAIFDDLTPDFTRVSGGMVPIDDGQPPQAFDIGTGPFLTEDLLSATALDGTKLLEMGFLPGSPNNLYWSASLPSIMGFPGDDAMGPYMLPQNVPTGQIGFGLDVTANFAPSIIYLNIPNFDIVFGAGGQSQFVGSGHLLGVGGGPWLPGPVANPFGAKTPFDVFNNVDVSFMPIPEPGSILVWAVLGLTVVMAARVRRRKGA